MVVFHLHVSDSGRVTVGCRLRRRKCSPPLLGKHQIDRRCAANQPWMATKRLETLLMTYIQHYYSFLDDGMMAITCNINTSLTWFSNISRYLQLPRSQQGEQQNQVPTRVPPHSGSPSLGKQHTYGTSAFRLPNTP